MVETALVLVGIDETSGSFIVEEKSFAMGSDAAKHAKLDERELIRKAQLTDFKIICGERVVFDPVESRKKAEEQYNKTQIDHLKAEIKQTEKERKLSEIRQKDITELTEEEIVLLAQSRVHGDHFTVNGRPALGVPTTFEGEYKKIIDAIEQKMNRNTTNGNSKSH